MTHSYKLSFPDRETLPVSDTTMISRIHLARHGPRITPSRGIRDLVLQHDHAPSHTSAFTSHFLSIHDGYTLSHPPHSPGLSACDFWLHPVIKQRPGKKIFISIDNLLAAWNRELGKLDKKDFNHALSPIQLL
jgi:hypothetical protein